MPPPPWDGPNRYGSSVDRVRGLIRAIAALGVVLAACTPEPVGPPSPRPTPETVASTTTVTTTTTTTTIAVAGDGCEVFCLEYHINPAARWSDGTPVVAADFVYTLQIHTDPTTGAPREGYSLIRDVEIVDDQTLRMHFIAPHGAWQSLFDRVFREGSDLTDPGSLATTGPFRFAGWTEGESLTLERDPDWWALEDPLTGSATGDVAEIRFVFFDTPLDMAVALAGESVDVIIVRPDVATVERLRDAEGVDLRLVPGPFWEHIDFHHDDPMLSMGWVREVFSLAIDREKILDRTVRLLDPDAGPLDNTIWMSNTENYQPHFPDRYDPQEAERILSENGCARGDDGIMVCGNVRMSFVWASTNDDPARLQVFQSAREDLAQVGIDIIGDFRSPSSFVSRAFLFGGPDVWQIVNFSWRARSDPSPAAATYFCDDAGDLNVNRYCSGDVERLVREAEATVAPVGRASIYNRADRLYLEDLAVIPLYQKPTMIAWRDGISGPEPNFTYSTDLWNVSTWSGQESITVGLLEEPSRIDPRSRTEDSANVILSAMLYGAFGMTPTHEHVPVLVDSVEVIEGR
jgi:peptide/nickel transport system substrate-binding protein